MDCLTRMFELANAHRVVRMTYRKTAEEEPSDRLVEAYRTSHNDKSMIIQCWQAAPVVIDGAQWRWFRADRIIKVTDGGSNFIPRLRMQLSLEEIERFSKERDRETAAEAVEKYFRYVENAMMDGHISEEEMA